MLQGFTGIFIFVGLFVLIRFILTRDNSYLYYGIYVFLTGIYLIIDPEYTQLPKGLLSLTGETAYIYFRTPLLLLSYIFYHQFMLSFLQLPSTHSRVARFLIFSMKALFLFFLMSIVSISFFESYSGYLSFVLLIAVMILGGVGVYLIAKINTTLSTIIVTGTILYMSGSIIGFLDSYFQILPETSLLSFAPFSTTFIGFVIEMILFSIGFNYRMRKIEEQRMETQKMKELYKTKSEFFSSISHELRTPLTLIKGMTAELKAHQVYKNKINEQCQKMIQLIDDLLLLSKSEAGLLKNEPEPTELEGLTQLLIQNYTPLAEKLDMKIQAKIDMNKSPVLIDSHKFKTILGNLLINAIKYGSAEGKVIEVYLSQKEKVLELIVEDDGPGIAERHLPFIFDRYYRGQHDSSKHKTGTGIGLALVKKYVELMDGRIEVINTKPTGCRFTIEWPYHRAIRQNSAKFSAINPKKAPALQNGNQGQNQSEAPKILVVEDHVEVAQMVARLVEGRGYQAIIASNGQEGLKKSCREIPDLIITDVRMPKMGGHEFCQAVKSESLTEHIPVIMLTAKAERASKIKGLRYGANAYIEKPFDSEELLAQIQQIFDRREQLQRFYQKSLSEANNTVKTITKKPIPPFIEKVTKIIDDHKSDSAFGVQELSKELLMDRTQVFRKLKALVGTTPSQLLKQRRLELAEKLLKTQNLSIAMIAEKSGFNSQSYFTRVFKEKHNCSPSEFKQKIQT